MYTAMHFFLRISIADLSFWWIQSKYWRWTIWHAT